MEAFQAPSWDVFKRERASLDPLKSHHSGSPLRAEKRQSLTLSHTPTLALLLPTAPPQSPRPLSSSAPIPDAFAQIFT